MRPINNSLFYTSRGGTEALRSGQDTSSSFPALHLLAPGPWEIIQSGSHPFGQRTKPSQSLLRGCEGRADFTGPLGQKLHLSYVRVTKWPKFKNLSFQQCKQYKNVSVTATTLELKYKGNSYFAHRWKDKIHTKPRDTSVTNVSNNWVSPQNLHWKGTSVRKHIPCRRTPVQRDKSLIMAGLQRTQQTHNHQSTVTENRANKL